VSRPGTILWVLLVFGLWASVSFAGVFIDGKEFATIGAALQAAGEGETIEVRGGEYAEHLRIDQNVHLKGMENPVIRVPGGRIVEISGPNVIIEGFTFTYKSSDLAPTDTAIYIDKGADGTVIRNNRFMDVMFGIWNVEGRDIRIENNIIAGIESVFVNDRGNCINLTGSQKTRIINNRLRDCRDGIYMELCHDATVTGNDISRSRYSVHTMWVDRGNFSRNKVYDNLVGLAIMYTKHSRINDNLSYGNHTHGILFIQTLRSEITGNKVIGNTKGIFLYNSVYNELSSNLILNNQLGLHNWGGSEDNRVHDNSFIRNEIQVKFVAGKNQEWDSNYWSDYIGWDMTGDGIGDYPYESNSVVDHLLWRYPLAKVLYTSPSLQLLWMLEKQFPVIAVPRVVDNRPAMAPLYVNWKALQEQYSTPPKRIYGEIEKLPHLPGGGG